LSERKREGYKKVSGKWKKEKEEKREKLYYYMHIIELIILY